MDEYNQLITEIMEDERYRQVVYNEARKMADSWATVGGIEWPFFDELENARKFDKTITICNEYRDSVFEKAQRLHEDFDVPLSQYIKHEDFYYKLEETTKPGYKAFSATKKGTQKKEE